MELPAAGAAPEYAPSWEDTVLGSGLESQPVRGRVKGPAVGGVTCPSPTDGDGVG